MRPAVLPAHVSRVRHVGLWLALILAIGAALRFRGLDYALWYDEIASSKFAEAPLRLLWSSWMVNETNPPLYYSALHLWSATFGDTDVALRAMSAVIGCAALGLVFLLGRRVGGDRAGLAAAALLALSAQHIMYSQQVRGYALAHAAALGSLLGAMMALEGWGRRTAPASRLIGLALYVGSSLVAVYSHTLLVLLPALASGFVLAGFLLGFLPLRRLLEWIVATAIIAAGWAWWGWMTLVQAASAAAGGGISWMVKPSFAYAVRMTLESYTPWGSPLQLAAAAFMAVAAAAMAYANRRRPALLLPVVAALAPALLYLLSFKIPVFLPRTVYFASGAFTVAAAAGLTLPRSARVGLALTGVALCLELAGLASWWPRREIEPWRDIVAQISRFDAHATVVTVGAGPAFALKRYCQPTSCALDIRTLPGSGIDRWTAGFKAPGELSPNDVPVLLKEHKDVVLVRWLGDDPAAQFAGAAQLVGPVGEMAATSSIGISHWRER